MKKIIGEDAAKAEEIRALFIEYAKTAREGWVYLMNIEKQRGDENWCRFPSINSFDSVVAQIIDHDDADYWINNPSGSFRSMILDVCMSS